MEFLLFRLSAIQLRMWSSDYYTNIHLHVVYCWGVRVESVSAFSGTFGHSGQAG